MNTENQYKDLIVTLDHPHGQVEVTLNEWFILGPGSDHQLKPSALKERNTDKTIPLSVIPLKYRNSFMSRLLMKLHLLSDPWKV